MAIGVMRREEKMKIGVRRYHGKRMEEIGVVRREEKVR